MKKINITPKAKKVVLAAGVFILCGGVLAAVLGSSKADVKTSGTSSTEVSSSADITLASIDPSKNSGTADKSGTASAFDPQKEKSRSEALTSSSKSTSKPPKPVVKGDSKNGSQPTNSALTDKTKKPTYSKKPTAKPKASTKSNNNSKSTAGNDDPIFGDKVSPPGSMAPFEGSGDSGDINKQVGIMD